MSAIKSFLLDQIEEVRVLLSASPNTVITSETHSHITFRCPNRRVSRSISDALYVRGFAIETFGPTSLFGVTVRAHYHPLT